MEFSSTFRRVAIFTVHDNEESKPMVVRYRHPLIWFAFSCLFWTGCGSSDLVTLQGAGATFPEPLYKRWFREYYDIEPSVRVSYQGLGSGAGIRQFTAGLVDFGASDSAMSSEEMKQVPKWGVVLLPMTSGCVVLAYNLPGVSQPIRLPRAVYPQDFSGKNRQVERPGHRRGEPGRHAAGSADHGGTPVRR